MDDLKQVVRMEDLVNAEYLRMNKGPAVLPPSAAMRLGCSVIAIESCRQHALDEGYNSQQAASRACDVKDALFGMSDEEWLAHTFELHPVAAPYLLPFLN